MNECDCIKGMPCTKSTVCAIESALRDQADEYEVRIERLGAQIQAADECESHPASDVLMYSVRNDHERIWLEPKCCSEDDYEGRHWCLDVDVFQHNGDPDDDEHQPPTEYVRADLYAELETQIAAVKKDAVFYKCCARSGEYPKDGSEPSALECNRSKQMEKNDPRIKKVQKQYAQMKNLMQEVYQDGYDEGGKSVAALECKVDALMWEFCPDEITTEQWRNWARHQVPVSAKVEAEIDKALEQNDGR